MSRPEDLEVDDHEEEAGDRVDDVQERHEGDEGDVCLSVAQKRHRHTRDEAEGPDEEDGGVAPLLGHVSVVLECVDHSDVLIYP